MIQKLRCTALCLLGISLALCLAGFYQLCCLRIGRHKDVSHMISESVNHQSSVEAVRQDIVDNQHHIADLILKRQVDNFEIVLSIEDIKVFKHLLVGDVSLTERCSLIENGQCVTHAAVGLLGYHVKCLLLVCYALTLGYILQVSHDALHRHTLEVINLAA